jgi:outer membrane protein assembly factor BamB
MCLLAGLALFIGPGCAGNKNAGKGLSDIVPIPAGSFSRQWRAMLKLQSDPADRIYVRGDTIFLYSRDNVVYALNRTGGDLKFIDEVPVSGGVLRPPVIMGTAIVYPSGSTIEIHNERGNPIKTIPLEKPTRSGAVAIGENLYLGLDHTGGTSVLASLNVNRQFHWTNWELMAFGAMTPTPAAFDKVIFYGSEDGDLGAVNENRAAVWGLPGGVFKTQGDFLSDIKADDFGVYAANTDTKLYCLDRATGKIKWQFYGGVPLKNSPVITPSTVYQFVPGQGIVAIDKIKGTFDRQPKWTVKDAVQVLSEDAGNVYLRADDNRILAADRDTGEIRFTSKSRKYTVFATNLADSMIYAATKDGEVVQIQPITRAGAVGTLVMAD